MNLNRRTFLKTSGAILVAIVGGGVYRAVDQGVFASGQGIAYEPWKNWHDGTTSPERIGRAGFWLPTRTIRSPGVSVSMNKQWTSTRITAVRSA
jgi:hypothetical protein